MARLSDCLKIVEGFDEAEISALEKRARKAAGTAKFSNDHFRIAAENMLGEAELEFNTLKRLGDERRNQLGAERRARQFDVKVSQDFNPREQRIGQLRLVRNKEEWGTANLRRLTALDEEVVQHPEMENAVLLTNPVGETILDDVVAWAERKNVSVVVSRPQIGATQQEYIRRGFVPQGDYMVRTTEKVAARDAAREQKAGLKDTTDNLPEDRTGDELLSPLDLAARYSETKDKKEAVRLARFIWDLANTPDEYGGSAVTRELAKEIFEEVVDPITREQVRKMPWVNPPTSETAGTVLRREAEGAPAAGMKAADVNKYVDGITAKWKNAPRIRVVQAYEDLPERIRGDVKRRVYGVFSPNSQTVYLVADELANEKDVLVTLLHESVGHYGMRGLLGDQYKAVMNRIYLGNERIRRKVNEMMGLDKDLTREVAVEEVLAHMAERYQPSESVYGRILQFIRDALNRIFGRGAVTMEDVHGLLLAARRFVEDGVNEVNARGTAPETGALPKAVEFTAAQQKELDAWGMPAPEEHAPMARAWNTLKSAVLDWRNRPWTLGWMTMRQIQDRHGAKDKSSPIDRFVETYLRMGRRAEEIANELNSVLKPWRNLPAEVQRRLGMLMIEAGIEQIHPDVAFTHEANSHLRSKNEQVERENRERYERLRSKYVAFVNQFPRAGEVYSQAKEANQKLWQMMYEARADDIMRLYKNDLKDYYSEDALKKIVRSKEARKQAIDSIKGLGMSYNEARTLRNLVEAADTNYKEFAQMKGPYFPLTRHGNHVVVAKSEAMKTAIAEFKEANDGLQKLYDQRLPDAEAERADLDQAIEIAKELVSKARAKIETMKGSERHYSVTFFEKDWEAQAYAKKLKEDADVAKYGLQVGVEQRAEHYQQFDGASPQFIRKLEEQLKVNLPKAEWAGVKNAVREIYMRAAPDRSALKGELRRLNVPGAKATEMLRGFAQRGMGNAFRISRMEFGGELHDALNALKQSDKRDDVILGNEMSRRLMHSFTANQSNAVVDGLAQVTHMTYLGLSPAYSLVNASQPWVISLPVMAARHGFSRSGKALFDASGEVMQVIKVLRKTEYDKLKTDEEKLAWIKSFRFNIQPEKLGKTEAEIAMLKDLFNDGLIDITVEHDLGAVSSGASRNWLTVASEISATPAHVIEIVNRVATALAAFRVERQRGTAKEQATDYARQVVADTHLDYSAENAPRFMRADAFGGLGRLIFQFRKFQQGMIYLTYKLGMDAFKGDKEARRGFTYLMGMQIGVAGMAGIPMAGGVRVLVNMLEQLWDDDDEPDLQEMFYNGMKDAVGETLARALLKGLPAAGGLDLSKRIGLGELTDPLRFASLEGKSGKDLVMATAFGVFGPSGSMLANWADAATTAATDPLKAAQLAIPKVLADPLRAYERADRGLQSRGGDQLIAKEEFNAVDLGLKALGFESTKVTDMYDTRSAINRLKSAQNNARSALIKEFVQARQEGKPTGDVMDRISEFNRRNPNDRITMKTLNQSAESRAKAAKEMTGGARVGKRDKDVLDQVGL